MNWLSAYFTCGAVVCLCFSEAFFATIIRVTSGMFAVIESLTTRLAREGATLITPARLTAPRQESLSASFTLFAQGAIRYLSILLPENLSVKLFDFRMARTTQCYQIGKSIGITIISKGMKGLFVMNHQRFTCFAFLALVVIALQSGFPLFAPVTATFMGVPTFPAMVVRPGACRALTPCLIALSATEIVTRLIKLARLTFNLFTAIGARLRFAFSAFTLAMNALPFPVTFKATKRISGVRLVLRRSLKLFSTICACKCVCSSHTYIIAHCGE